MVIVDTSVWIDYLADRSTLKTDWLDREIGIDAVGLTDLILCEILQGIRDDREFTLALSEFSQLHIFDTGGAQSAVRAARNYRVLRQKGITVRRTIDCLIANFCIETGIALLHCDRDFDPFEQHLGLRVIDP